MSSIQIWTSLFCFFFSVLFFLTLRIKPFVDLHETVCFLSDFLDLFFSFESQSFQSLRRCVTRGTHRLLKKREAWNRIQSPKTDLREKEASLALSRSKNQIDFVSSHHRTVATSEKLLATTNGSFFFFSPKVLPIEPPPAKF